MIEPNQNDPTHGGVISSTFPARLADVIGDSSVRAFARRAGVSDTFLRQCLAGRTEPTRPKILAIAQAGGVSVEWLATGNGTRTYGLATPTALDSGHEPDRETLEAVVEIVESVLDDSDQPLSPSNKARLICAVYEMRSSHGARSLLPERVRELMLTA
jgi:transcriptional regulator with XRE-family HTH domain